MNTRGSGSILYRGRRDCCRSSRVVEKATASPFNSVLLNYYRNERDSMGMHSDDEPELGLQPVIASFSLGEARTLVFRHRSDRSRESLRLELGDGSLLLMRGASQRNWKHGIAKERRACGARVNLTFRRIFRDPDSSQVIETATGRMTPLCQTRNSTV